MKIILRILSGLHEGAHMELSSGDWEVGSDALCDILLSDIAPNQALLRVLDDGCVWLLPSSKQGADVAKNYVQGQEITAEGIEIPAYTCISLGNVHAAIGNADMASWPRIELPSKQGQDDAFENQIVENELKSERGQVLQERAKVEAKAPSASGQSASGQNASGQGTSGQNTTISVTNIPDMPKPITTKNRIVLRVFLLILLFALCLGGLYSVTGPSEAEIQAQNIQAVLSSQNSSWLKIEQDEEGTWIVSGGVRDSKVQQELEQALGGLEFKTKTALVALDDLAQSLEARIKAEGAILRVRSLQDGLRISGYIFDEKALDELLAPLQEDIKLVNIQKDVAFYAQIENALEENLKISGLQEVVKLNPASYGIVLELGPLSAEQNKKLQSFIQQSSDMTRGLSPFIKAKPKEKPKVEESPKKVVAVKETDFCASLSIGGNGAQLYVIYQNNNYLRGSHLPNGLQVQEIRETYSTYTLDDRLFYCPR